MPLYRMQAAWNGFTGAPGYTNMHFLKETAATQTELNDTAAKVRTFFDAWKSYLPNVVTISFASSIFEFDPGTGVLEDEHSITTPTGVTGTGGSAVFSSAVGACVTWKTSTVVDGRRLRGRTFMVPLQSLPSFDATGTLNGAAVVIWNSAAQALIDSASGLPFVIWHRPLPGAGGGVAGQVTSHSIADKTAVLRSRRD